MGGKCSAADDGFLLKSFFSEVSEVERDNEVIRIFACFKLNPFECLNLPFEESPEDVKKQTALTKAQQLLLDMILYNVNQGKYDQQYDQSEQFQQELKLKLRDILTEQKWRRRKLQMRLCCKLKAEGRLKKDEEDQKETWKRKREHDDQWEGSREKRVSSWRDFMKTGKKLWQKVETLPPNKSYVQRPVKRLSEINFDLGYYL
ncbi:hypothetical protein K2173_013928 [Erythroxylum novogranatense]|uniref:Uncharacterized protein n=1 Tax=Erythroxylum novogranatense TaxID=1862640 RepID=A0AAV8SCV2_9ROSI|nr:hypothetical protein K2173_013928 [Erythroxylum novogranatense]